MHIAQLNGEHFRNLQPFNLHFHPRLNWIYGANGSGKTALLEALYFLGRGKSFRESQTRHIIAHHQAHFRLIAHIQHQRQHLLGIERQIRDYQVRLDGADLRSLTQLAELLPIQIINSDHFALIDAGPEHRRRFMDYGLFYHDPAFLPAWQHYQYALKNRNAALRQDWDDHYIHIWHQQLEHHANHIDQLRQHYLHSLERQLNHYHAELGGLETLHLHYLRGWAQGQSLSTLLNQHLNRDRALKHTRDGCHRSEWRILTDSGQDAAHHFSRGQQKTLICALILAQTQLIAEKSGKYPVILVDDIAAELDHKRQNLLINFLHNSGSQLFITAIETQPQQSDSAAHHFQLQTGHIAQLSGLT